MKIRSVSRALWLHRLFAFGWFIAFSGVVAVWAWHKSEEARSAVVDAATPLSQNGFTLLAVQRWRGSLATRQPMKYVRVTPRGKAEYENFDTMGSMEQTVLWIAEPSLVTDDRGFDPRTQFTVQGRASNGDVFRLPFRLVGSMGASPQLLLCVRVPSCYPDTYRWIDVTVSTKSGKSARWRLTHLPPTYRFLPPNTPAAEKTTIAGVTARGTAIRRPDGRTAGAEEVWANIELITLSQPAHQYAWSMRDMAIDWMPSGYGSVEPSSGSGNVRFTQRITEPTQRREQSPYWLVGTPNASLEDPYLDTNRLVRCTANITEYETCEETVTFHDITLSTQSGPAYGIVTLPQTLTTPGGVTVTLPAQGKAGELISTTIGGPDGKIQHTLNLMFRMSPLATQEHPASLPASPVAKQFHKSVSLELESVAPYTRCMGGPDAKGVWTLTMKLPSNTPAHIRDFAIVVQHRVDLQTFPVTLTLPIKAEDSKHKL